VTRRRLPTPLDKPTQRAPRSVEIAGVLVLGLLLELRVHTPSRRVRAERAAEEQDVRLRPGGWFPEVKRSVSAFDPGASEGVYTAKDVLVDRVVHPAAALLHAQLAPLGLGQQAVRQVALHLLGQDHMPADHHHQ
jgi:hypothetical protein